MIKWIKKLIKRIRTNIERLVKTVPVVYATLIINGKKSFSEVPELLKEKVRQVLIDLDLGELAVE